MSIYIADPSDPIAQMLREYNPTKEELFEQAEPLCWGEGESNPFYGKTHSPETKEKMRLARLGKKRAPHSEETKRKMSESAMGKPGTNTGKTFGSRTEEQKKRISEATRLAMQNQPEIQCPHCNKYGKKAVMKRWHFDNCKMR